MDRATFAIVVTGITFAIIALCFAIVWLTKQRPKNKYSAKLHDAGNAVLSKIPEPPKEADHDFFKKAIINPSGRLRREEDFLSSTKQVTLEMSELDALWLIHRFGLGMLKCYVPGCIPRRRAFKLVNKLVQQYQEKTNKLPPDSIHLLEMRHEIMSECHADTDGDCEWEGCPQKRNGEPAKTGRHCPLDDTPDEDRRH